MDIRKSEKNAASDRSLPYMIILALALSAGCWSCAFSMTGGSIPIIGGLIAVALMPAAMVVLCRMETIGKYAAFAVLLMIALYVLLFYDSVWNGLLIMINGGIDRLNSLTGSGYLEFTVSGSAGARSVLMAVLPMILATSAAVAYSLVSRKPLMGLIFTALPVLAGLVFQGTPSPWAFILLLVAWMALLLMPSGSGGLPILAVALVIMTLMSLVFPATDWSPSSIVSAARDKITGLEEAVRYGGDIESLSEGDLTDVHPLKYDDRAVFKLHMDLGQSIYLRGFTGADFYDDKWTTTDDTAYSGDYKGICQWLEKDGIYPWLQLDALYRMDPESSFSDMTLVNKRASSKYMWIPYEAAVTGDLAADKARFDQDRAVFSRGFDGRRSYEIRLFNSSLKEFSQTSADNFIRSMEETDGYDNYLRKERVYGAFADRTYRGITEDQRSMMESTGIDKCRSKSLDYTIYYIRDLFDKNYKYSTEVKAAAEGKDQLDYFLNDSHKGNEMHFATAAVLMLRQAGFTARYAEGYYVSPQYLALYSDLNNVDVNVPDSLSHAWAEVYYDGIGWMPVEFVPGFYDMDKQLTKEKEPEETTTDSKSQTYQDSVPLEDNSGPSIRKNSHYWWILILLGILILLALLILAYEKIGQRMALRMRDTSEIYRRISRLLRFAGIEIDRDPYRYAGKISSRYDGSTESSYREIMKMIYAERYGGEMLDAEELEILRQYAAELSAGIYHSEKSAIRRFIMRYLLLLNDGSRT